MKRQRRESGGSAGVEPRPLTIGLQASAGPTKVPVESMPRHVFEAGPDSPVWTRYIDSRLKQFCTR